MNFHVAVKDPRAEISSQEMIERILSNEKKYLGRHEKLDKPNGMAAKKKKSALSKAPAYKPPTTQCCECAVEKEMYTMLNLNNKFYCDKCYAIAKKDSNEINY